MKCKSTICVHAAREKVWAIIRDVNSWPRWSGRIRHTALHESSVSLNIGAKFQLRFAAGSNSTWIVTKYTPHTRFTCESTIVFQRWLWTWDIESRHAETKLIRRIETRGVFSILSRPFRGTVQRLLNSENERLKAYCEQVRAEGSLSTDQQQRRDLAHPPTRTSYTENCLHDRRSS